MDRRGIFGDRRSEDRREGPAFRPAREDRRSGDERRADERRTDVDDRRRRGFERGHRSQPESVEVEERADRTTSLPPISRLIPAAVVLVVSLADLSVAQATSQSAWALVVVAAAIPIAGFALAPRRWHLAAVWFAVGLYVMAAVVHMIYLVTR